MKKRLVFAICGCMLMLAACGNAKETVTTSEVEAKEVAADLFEITMPDEFSGLFEAEVSEGRIDVYHKESRQW